MLTQMQNFGTNSRATHDSKNDIELAVPAAGRPEKTADDYDYASQ